MSEPHSAPWWQGGALSAGPRGLQIGERAVADLAAQHGTPLYVYDSARVAEHISLLRRTLDLIGKPARIHYALKANRCPAVLRWMRAHGGVGIDACSPREVGLALDHGFAPAEISVTASVLPDRDLRTFVAQGVHLNLDSADVVRRYAAVAPTGTAIGLRIDPETRMGYGDATKLNYGGGKLGLAPEDVVAVARLARDLGLRVDTLHLHLGWGIQRKDEPAVREALRRLRSLAIEVGGITVLNVGGGLGGRLRAEDDPLPPARWGQAIGEALGDLDVELACEPGTLLMAHAGLLVVQVTSTFEKKGQRWAGVDAGLGINVYAAHYGAPLSVLDVARPLDAAGLSWNLAGHINEAADVLGRDVSLGALAVGDLLALYPAGAYGSSMASDHCMRGGFAEVLV